MAKLQRRGAEEARAQLPALLADAERGRTTIVQRRGRPIAAVVPVSALAGPRQAPLTGLAGSGRGLWGSDSTQTLRRLRDEWSR